MGLIRIHELELDCIVGIRPDERLRAQRLRLDVEVGVDTRQAARTGRIATTVDWNRAAQQLSVLLRFRRYRLLEVAAEELSAMLLGVYAHPSSVRLRLEKPGALEGRARAASVEVFRQRSDFGLPDAAPPESFASYSFPVQLTATSDATLTLHGVAPGERMPMPNRGERRAISWLVRGQLTDQAGCQRRVDTPEDCEGESWSNLGKKPAVVFRCAVFNEGAAQ
jgi:7,8-dihydroneopterin aldolase/epimerase/oxygenase